MESNTPPSSKEHESKEHAPNIVVCRNFCNIGDIGHHRWLITGQQMRLLNAMLAFSLLLPAWLLTGCDYSQDTIASKVSPVSWTELLAIAQQEATKVSTNAVLSSVAAAPIEPLVEPRGYVTDAFGLRVTFEFASPPSTRITIVLTDTEPTWAPRIEEASLPEYKKLLTPELLRVYSIRSRKMRQGPRQAIQATWAYNVPINSDQGLR